MRLINPQFQHDLNIDRLDDNFLNDFVGLYRHFFYKFEEMFNFKLKLQNLIRPTNVRTYTLSTTSSSIWSATSSISAGTTTSRPSSGTWRPSKKSKRSKKKAAKTFSKMRRTKQKEQRRKLGGPVSMKWCCRGRFQGETVRTLKGSQNPRRTTTFWT